MIVASKMLVSVAAHVALAPMLPASGSSEKPAWLANCRRANGMHFPSDNDFAGLVGSNPL